MEKFKEYLKDVLSEGTITVPFAQRELMNVVKKVIDIQNLPIDNDQALALTIALVEKLQHVYDIKIKSMGR